MRGPRKGIFRQLAVILALAVTVLVNALASILPINGQTTGEIADKYPVLFVPAGFVFSIWSLIYIGMFAYAVYQAMPSNRKDEKLRSIAWWFIFGCAANSGWIVAWHYNYVYVSIVLMVMLFFSLAAIYTQLEIGKSLSSNVERYLVRLPFSLYFGWITVATIANMTVVLYVMKWDGFGLSDELWASILVITATLIGLIILLSRRDYVYMLVIMWALFGIAIKFEDRLLLASVADAAVLILAGCTPIAMLFKKPSVITELRRKNGSSLDV